MKQTKRIFSLLLSLCLVLGLIPGTAFAAGGNLPFTDVNTTDWCYDAVQYVYEKGMMNGTSTTTFSPDGTTTRGMIVTILHRMEGTPAATGTVFTDVPTGQWYSDAVSWASANGIVGGYGNGRFGPGDPITREQMAAILNRYSTYKGYDAGTVGNITSFSDASQVSTYAVEPMGWAIGNGLISGVGNNTLAPKGNATRAQVATILKRFCENIVDKAHTAPETPVGKTYTVTFDLNYGSDTRYDVKTVKEGETVSRPSNPTRSGHSFNGWYAEKSGGKQFDFKTGITSDLTLYAHWSNSGGGSGSSSGGGGSYVPPSTTYYTVTFYMNDGTNAVHTTTNVSAGSSVSAPAQPVRSGYSFSGWYTDKAATETYSFSNAVTGNLALYAKWDAVTTEPVDGFTLRTDKATVFIGEGSEDVHLYLETNLTVDSIDLQYGTDSTWDKSVSLYDNGQDADDIAGDGIYSAVIFPHVTEDTEVSFVARYDTVSSNIVNVMYYTPISDETYEAMETVDQKIEDLLAQPGFTDKPDEEKIVTIQDLLQGFAETGMIQDGSIYVDKENKLVSFLYPEGILGGIMYGEFEIDKNGFDSAVVVTDDALLDDDAVASNDGVGDTGVPDGADLKDVNEVDGSPDYDDTTNINDVADDTAGPDDNDGISGDSAGADGAENGIPERAEAPDSYEIYDDFTDNNLQPFADANAEQAEEIGSAIILNSFPAFETDPDDIAYRTNFYNTLKSTWDNSGLKTTLLVNPTVGDYKNLDKFNMICISTHGSVYTWNDGFLWLTHHEYPAICLAEKQSKNGNKEYKKELKSKQIAKVNGCYWILPSFFTNQYDEDAFSESFVFSECCEAMGKGKGSSSSSYDYSMANAFTGRSAKAYIGFHNSVFADYSREFMEEYVDSLIAGKTSRESFDSAIDKMGSNHEVWYNNHSSITLKQYYEEVENPPEKYREEYKPLIHIAYPVHNGNGNAILVNLGLQNGGFEKFSWITTLPQSWECLGDVRTLAQLGPVKPSGSESKRMAIVTTGIGSQGNAAFEGGTEGSKLSQTFKVPEGASKIVFQYNFISEEPMEYVGSEFDDSFVVQVLQGGTAFYNHMYESINTSEWKEVSGIDFIGGDHTTFQTGWKNGEIDISAYSGKIITLSFVIYDVGDQIYDSACVIDNVIVQ